VEYLHVYGFVLFNDVNNLKAVCESCNTSKRDRAITDAWLTKRSGNGGW
jgi:hypothetical protein